MYFLRFWNVLVGNVWFSFGFTRFGLLNIMFPSVLEGVGWTSLVLHKVSMAWLQNAVFARVVLRWWFLFDSYKKCSSGAWPPPVVVSYSILIQN